MNTSYNQKKRSSYMDQVYPTGMATISGKISGVGVDVSNIIISDGLLKDTTDATGTYRFSGISNGRHTIIPSRKGLRSTPAALVVVVDGKDMSDQNFVCENIPPPTFSISGNIVSNGIALSGVVVTDSIYSTRSDSAGHYIISGVSHGIHTITPSSGNLIFTPRTRRVAIDGDDIAGQDFHLLMGMTLINIPGGTFSMGSANRNANERPVHQVTVSPFQIGEYEITQAEWRSVMNANPGFFHGDNLPVEQVSWSDAVAFCNKLSVREGLTPAYIVRDTNVVCDFHASGYRLPTEAEWEYACRAGTTTDRYSGDVSRLEGTAYFFEPNLDTIAWYNPRGISYGDGTHAIGEKRPNAFGLYDMLGNVAEWCWDYWGSSYPSAPQINPTGPTAAGPRVIRGGSWYNVAWELRSAFRRAYPPGSQYSGLGFRIVRSLP